MTRYINGDAKDEHGRRFPTKKALKEAFKAEPALVTLLPTELFTTDMPTLASDVKPGEAWSIVGPNPYSDRRWYATVEHNSKGQVTVS